MSSSNNKKEWNINITKNDNEEKYAVELIVNSDVGNKKEFTIDLTNSEEKKLLPDASSEPVATEASEAVAPQAVDQATLPLLRNEGGSKRKYAKKLTKRLRRALKKSLKRRK